MKNRKSVMTVSALLILYYHLGIFVFTRNPIELFIKAMTFVGVDMFFFLSAYSISLREVTDYKKFILSRINNVYLKFLLFAIIALFVSKWELSKFFKVIIGAELFSRGGGSFLWFLPAIMIFYLILPLYQWLDKKNRAIAIISAFIIWFGVGVAVTKFTGYSAMFIFWNRIPVLLVGFYAAKIQQTSDWLDNKWIKFILGLIFVAVGTFILYKWGYKPALRKPIRDMFYVLGIPSTIGLVLLTDLIPEIKINKWIGSSTLELYAIQMIFGFSISNFILKQVYRFTVIPFWTNLFINIFVIVLVTAISVIARLCFDKFVVLTKGLKKRNSINKS